MAVVNCAKCEQPVSDTELYMSHLGKICYNCLEQDENEERRIFREAAEPNRKRGPSVTLKMTEVLLLMGLIGLASVGCVAFSFFVDLFS